MSKSVMTVRLPEALKDVVADEAQRAGVSVNQYVVYSLIEKTTSAQTARFFEERRSGRSREEIFARADAVMEKLRNRPQPPLEEIPEWDRWPEGMEPPDF